jgi:hypothetical protein
MRMRDLTAMPDKQAFRPTRRARRRESVRPPRQIRRDSRLKQVPRADLSWIRNRRPFPAEMLPISDFNPAGALYMLYSYVPTCVNLLQLRQNHDT